MRRRRQPRRPSPERRPRTGTDVRDRCPANGAAAGLSCACCSARSTMARIARSGAAGRWSARRRGVSRSAAHRAGRHRTARRGRAARRGARCGRQGSAGLIGAPLSTAAAAGGRRCCRCGRCPAAACGVGRRSRRRRGGCGGWRCAPSATAGRASTVLSAAGFGRRRRRGPADGLEQGVGHVQEGSPSGFIAADAANP